MANNKSIKMTEEILFVQNGYVAVPQNKAALLNDPRQLQLQSFGTLVSNIAYYGFIPSLAMTEKLMALNDAGLVEFWKKLKPALAYVTGDDKNMGKYIVYKNFPKEVLEMSEARYWTNQIYMYFGVPARFFAEKEQPRPPITDKVKLKVLDLAGEDTALKIFNKLCRVPASWTDFQEAQVNHLVDTFSQFSIDMDQFTHKENGAKLAARLLPEILEGRRTAAFSTATDVLRFAAAISEGDASLRETTRFRKLSRAERRLLVGLIDGGKNVEADFGMRPEQWKRLLSRLHPGDFKDASKVHAAYDRLYKREARTISSKIEGHLFAKDIKALDVLKSQPGQFARRLHHSYGLFGKAAFDAFKEVTNRLTVTQLVKLDTYLNTINNRVTQAVTPKGSWTKLQVLVNDKVKIKAADLKDIRGHISTEIGSRLDAMYPQGFAVDINTVNVKLQTNGQALAPYGRGTTFDLPQDANFIRMGSYWKMKAGYSVWFDVGCNFFDDNWNDKGTLCWSSTHPFGTGNPRKGERAPSAFSGDPISAADAGGRAGQLIDLYPKELIKHGVRYAVLNILSYNRIKFDDAEEVLATIQWGENPEKGKLFEPSRTQAVFPITGSSLTKYICYMDIVDRKLVYMDVDLRGSVRSAVHNAPRISAMMPAFVEYLQSLPSIADVFCHAKEGAIPVLHNDEGIELSGPAYIFQRRNAENQIEPIDMASILVAKADVVEDEYVARFGTEPGI
jgi:hypothetical protein